VGLNGFDYKSQLISISIAVINMNFYKLAVKGCNYIIMRKNIIEIEIKQRLFSIVITKVTPENIKTAFGKLLKELIIIADLFTLYKKVGIGKSCFWWCSKIEEANAKAKKDYRSYLAAPSDYRWAEYKKFTIIAKRTVEKAKASSWRRAIAAKHTSRRNYESWRDGQNCEIGHRQKA
jgi:hypothetical protein